ncbi:DEKNAAC104642 [Brettanomyces naardenensis]|uniref:Vesicular-fusion protein SEC18 n=1 Tax=Brettanomyces naardenensis TaxID=13370 RepID=A0A448YRM3_BRENA|nr:DEKNAAC104642 [Brettanomyces naardenensis]
MDKLPFRKGRSAPPKAMLVKNSPDNEIAKSNCIAVNPQDFQDNIYVACDGKYVFTTRATTKLMPGTVGLSGNQRFWGSWSTDQSISVTPYDLFSSSNLKKGAYLGSISVEINFWNKNRANGRMYDPDEMADVFVKKFDSQIMQPTQILLFEFKGSYFELKVSSTQVVELGEVSIDNVPVSSDISNKGIVVQQTVVDFYKGSDGLVNLKASSKRPNVDAIIRPDFKFEDMGIGGLDKEFTSIFRRAFASRIFPPALIEKLGIQHVKGMLLYGPPGTGKTLIARQIGKMLNAKEPKIVNGPEVLSKYVGSSEENIRNLFKDAEAEYKQKGDSSSLHIIIFDELDSIFKQRGSRGDGTGVADNVVNQLLAKMDGVDQLNNVLVIGMTNRKDLIDEALLRPGRFEVQVEIQLPDEDGRFQILGIKTKQMRENGALADDVDLHKLAKLTKNFSGAELEGLVKSATSFALSRHIKVGTVGQITGDLSNLVVSMDCFVNALLEVKPAYGVNEEDLKDCFQGGIIKYSPRIDNILQRVERDIAQLRNSEKFNFSSVLLYGPPGSGKTALAAYMAIKSKFPFIRMIASDEVIGMSESAKVQYIDNTFRDAYKSPLNILIVDDIEAIIDYVPIGPRFSSVILRALMTRMKKPPPEAHRLIVMATSSNYRLLKNLDILNCFNDEIAVNNLTSLEDLQNVMIKTSFGGSGHAAVEEVTKKLLEVFPDGQVNIPIKKVLFNIDTSKFSPSPTEELVQLTVESNRP